MKTIKFWAFHVDTERKFSLFNKTYVDLMLKISYKMRHVHILLYFRQLDKLILAKIYQDFNYDGNIQLM